MKRTLLSGLVVGLLLAGATNVMSEENKCNCGECKTPCSCGCEQEPVMQIRTELFTAPVKEEATETAKTELLNIQSNNEERLIDFEDTLTKKTEEIKPVEAELQNKEIDKMEFVGGLVTRYMDKPMDDETANERKQVIQQQTQEAIELKLDETKDTAESVIKENIEQTKTTVEEEINAATEEVKETIVKPVENKTEETVKTIEATKETIEETVSKPVEETQSAIEKIQQTVIAPVIEPREDENKIDVPLKSDIKSSLEEAQKNAADNIEQTTTTVIEKTQEKVVVPLQTNIKSSLEKAQSKTEKTVEQVTETISKPVENLQTSVEMLKERAAGNTQESFLDIAAPANATKTEENKKGIMKFFSKKK